MGNIVTVQCPQCKNAFTGWEEDDLKKLQCIACGNVFDIDRNTLEKIPADEPKINES
jgi:Zn ribbon nucleic-acid-binding protein